MPNSDLHQPARGLRLKRWLYVLHRWIGIGSCLLFAMWFLSGLVMIYVPFPKLTETERLAGLSAIDWRQVHSPLGREMLPGATLEMRGERAVWRLAYADVPEADILASDGHALARPTATEAMRTASLFGHASATAIEQIERDQWTVAGGFDTHRPLWKVSLAGPNGRVLYVSGRTGAVVLDTSAGERFWNWLGSVPHWLYPTVLRQDNALWRQVVMWVSGPCVIAGVTGFWIGILRTRLGRRRFKGGRMTPYRGWMAWHHWAGLVGGLLLIAWIFSGWLSVDPFRMFASGGVAPEALAAYQGASAPPAIDYSRLAARAAGAKQVELRWLGGRPLLDVRGIDTTRVFDAVTLAPFRPQLPLARLMPGAHVVAVDRLSAPDAYWYDVGALPRLPVLRVRYDDAAATWIYVDPESGAVLASLDTRRRVYRWLFDLLHKWDLNVLTLNRPSWDAVLWTFSLLGMITSVSGIWIGWKRLRRRPLSARHASIAAISRNRLSRSSNAATTAALPGTKPRHRRASGRRNA